MRSPLLVSMFFMSISFSLLCARDREVVTVQSPDRMHTIKLSPYTGERRQLDIEDQTLFINKGDRNLSSFPFSGQLVSVYWSPDERYVAIDNHYGHRAWKTWIISLADGALITSLVRCIT